MLTFRTAAAAELNDDISRMRGENAAVRLTAERLLSEARPLLANV